MRPNEAAVRDTIERIERAAAILGCNRYDLADALARSASWKSGERHEVLLRILTNKEPPA